jgi:hypothetical protein
MSRLSRAMAIAFLVSAGLVAAAPQSASALAPITGNLPVSLNVNVLNVVPENALGLITAHHILDTKKGVEGLLRKLEVPFDASGDYDKFTDFLEKLEGWDEKGTHAFVFLPVEGQDEPEFAVLVPVTNYKQFARALGADPEAVGPTEFKIEEGPDGYIAAKGDYAVLTENNADGRSMIDVVLNSKKSLAASSEPVRKWIGDHQLSAIVTPGGIQKGVDAALKGLEEAKKNVPDEPLPRILVKFFLPVMESILKTSREEMTHLAAAPSLDDTKGVAFSARAFFKPGGKFSGAVAGVPTLPADGLKHLPDEGYFTAAAYVYPDKLVDGIVDFMLPILDALKEEANLPIDVGQVRPLLEKSRAASKGMKFVSQVQSAAGESLYDGMAGLYEVADAEAFMKQQTEILKESIGIVRKLSDKIPEIPVEKKTVAGVEATVFSVDIVEIMSTFDENTFGQEPGKSAMKGMIGNDGRMTMYLGAVGPKHVVYAFGEKTFGIVADNVRGNKPGLADDLMIKKTAALLPTDLAMVGYVDIGGYITMVKNMMMKAMAAQQGQAQAIGGLAMLIPPFPAAPPVGYSLKLTSTSVEADFVVPIDLMTATRDYVKQVQQMLGGVLR